MTQETCSHKGIKIVALIASFNRCERTLHALGSILKNQSCLAEVRIVLCDDASTDGTAVRVHEEYPQVTVVDGTGDLYWCRGMHTAENRFRQKYADWGTHILWMNDDISLHSNALCKALDALDRCDIAVGRFSDTSQTRTTYGGYVRNGWRLLSLRRASTGERCDTFNGNFVLFPAAVYDALGGIRPVFSHSVADTDIGFRATRRGFSIYEVDETIGICDDHVEAPQPSLRKRLQTQFSRKSTTMRDFWALYWECNRSWSLLEFMLTLGGKLRRAFFPSRV